MSTWMYAVMSVAFVVSLAIFVVGIKLSLKRVPVYDVVAEAEQVAQQAWNRKSVQEL